MLCCRAKSRGSRARGCLFNFARASEARPRKKGSPPLPGLERAEGLRTTADRWPLPTFQVHEINLAHFCLQVCTHCSSFLPSNRVLFCLKHQQLVARPVHSPKKQLVWSETYGGSSWISCHPFILNLVHFATEGPLSFFNWKKRHQFKKSL